MEMVILNCQVEQKCNGGDRSVAAFFINKILLFSKRRRRRIEGLGVLLFS